MVGDIKSRRKSKHDIKSKTNRKLQGQEQGSTSKSKKKSSDTIKREY